ncbi:MAG: hypothetical protein GX362_05525 [Methanosarcinaceae archaeon]|nr:hypothetical protein [Methanosarcinaceae archaeon]
MILSIVFNFDMDKLNPFWIPKSAFNWAIGVIVIVSLTCFLYYAIINGSVFLKSIKTEKINKRAGIICLVLISTIALTFMLLKQPGLFIGNEYYKGGPEYIYHMFYNTLFGFILAGFPFYLFYKLFFRKAVSSRALIYSFPFLIISPFAAIFLSNPANRSLKDNSSLYYEMGRKIDELIEHNIMNIPNLPPSPFDYIIVPYLIMFIIAAIVVGIIYIIYRLIEYLIKNRDLIKQSVKKIL